MIHNNEFENLLTADTGAILKDSKHLWVHLNLQLLLFLKLGVPLLNAFFHPDLKWFSYYGVD